MDTAGLVPRRCFAIILVDSSLASGDQIAVSPAAYEAFTLVVKKRIVRYECPGIAGTH